MNERTDTIASIVGLHARPAEIFAEAAAEYGDLNITIAPEGDPDEDAMDASSVLSLMSLSAQPRRQCHLARGGHGAEEPWATWSGFSKPTTTPTEVLRACTYSLALLRHRPSDGESLSFQGSEGKSDVPPAGVGGKVAS
ncbi:HPr family phosphocarrier protein [Arthrobacter sp. ZGTC131]|uniref:HPr family phosphocarrier protein n=1 Tax=Arthrobacter sp. ZGTC131 TaxID=2058898 RepID=UPI0021571D86|nr:HPr family phosphocarrier protein [Arthrobacter sp. ZGTC131]